MDAYAGLCYILHSGGVPEIGIWFPLEAVEKIPIDFYEDILYEEDGELGISLDEEGLQIRYSPDFAGLRAVDRMSHAIKLAISLQQKLEHTPLFREDDD